MAFSEAFVDDFRNADFNVLHHDTNNKVEVLLKKVFFPDSWDQIWAKYLGLNPNLTFKLIEIRYQWS